MTEELQRAFLISEKWGDFLYEAWTDDHHCFAMAFHFRPAGKILTVEYIGENYPAWYITEDTPEQVLKDIQELVENGWEVTLRGLAGQDEVSVQFRKRLGFDEYQYKQMAELIHDEDRRSTRNL